MKWNHKGTSELNVVLSAMQLRVLPVHVPGTDGMTINPLDLQSCVFGGGVIPRSVDRGVNTDRLGLFGRRDDEPWLLWSGSCLSSTCFLGGIVSSFLRAFSLLTYLLSLLQLSLGSINLSKDFHLASDCHTSLPKRYSKSRRA